MRLNAAFLTYQDYQNYIGDNTNVIRFIFNSSTQDVYNYEINISSLYLLLTICNYFKLIDINKPINIPYFKSDIILPFVNQSDLFFMFSLSPTEFIETNYFLDYLDCHNDNDIKYSTSFIEYMINYDLILNNYNFMTDDIKSINNYRTNINMKEQVKHCTIAFYRMYLKRYKEEVISENRIDIYESRIHNKDKYYIYADKYNTILSNMIKEDENYLKWKHYINITSN